MRLSLSAQHTGTLAAALAIARGARDALAAGDEGRGAQRGGGGGARDVLPTALLPPLSLLARRRGGAARGGGERG